MVSSHWALEDRSRLTTILSSACSRRARALLVGRGGGADGLDDLVADAGDLFGHALDGRDGVVDATRDCHELLGARLVSIEVAVDLADELDGLAVVLLEVLEQLLAVAGRGWRDVDAPRDRLRGRSVGVGALRHRLDQGGPGPAG